VLAASVFITGNSLCSQRREDVNDIH